MKTHIITLISAMALLLSCSSSEILEEGGVPNPYNNEVILNFVDNNGNSVTENLDIFEYLYLNDYSLKEGSYTLKTYVNGEILPEEKYNESTIYAQKSPEDIHYTFRITTFSYANSDYWRDRKEEKDFVFRYLITIPSIWGELEHELIIHKSSAQLGSWDINKAILDGKELPSKGINTKIIVP